MLDPFASCKNETVKPKDWLIDPSGYKTVVRQEGDRVILSNGLVSRTVSLKPGGATVSF